MRPLARLALASLLTACAPQTPPAEAPPAPAPEASAGPPAPAPTTSSTAAPVASEPPSPYFPVLVNASGTLRFHRLKHGAAVTVGAYQSQPVLVSAEGARLEPKLYQGLQGAGDPPAFLVASVSGDWPRSGSLSLNLPGDRGGTDVDYVWSGSTWVKAPKQPLGDMTPEVVAAYYQGGLFGSASWSGHSLYYLFGSRFVPAKGARVTLPAMAKGGAGCEHRLMGYLDLSNVGGDLQGIGKLCTGKDDAKMETYTQDGAGALAIERWSQGQTRSTVVELPGSAGRGSIGIRAVAYHEAADGSAYVYATFPHNQSSDVYVARWDGKTWTDVSPTAEGETVQGAWSDRDGSFWLRLGKSFLVRRAGGWQKLSPSGVSAAVEWADRAPDGTLWALFGDALWHLGADGAWEKAVLPHDAGGAPLLARWAAWIDDQMLIAAQGRSGARLLGSRKPSQVLDLGREGGAPAPDKAEKSVFGRVGPPSAGCQSLFAVLYKLSRVAPPDFDFPLTRAALKGHSELSDVRFAETEDAGTRYLVAFVPNLQRGRALVELLRGKVQGSNPQLLCGTPPKTNRAIDIDLRTGALRK